MTERGILFLDLGPDTVPLYLVCPGCHRAKAPGYDTCGARLCRRIHRKTHLLATALVALGASIGRFVRRQPATTIACDCGHGVACYCVHCRAGHEER